MIALCLIYRVFATTGTGSEEIYEKLESMLETDLEKKKSTLDLEEVVPMLQTLGTKQCGNPNVWKYFLEDFEQHL